MSTGEMQELKQFLSQEFAVVNNRLSHLEDRVAGLERRMERLETRMDSLEARMDSLETRMDSLEARMDKLETRQSHMETTFQGLTAWVTEAIDTMHDVTADQFKKYDIRIAHIEHKMA